MAGALVGGAFLSTFLQVAFDRVAFLDFIKGTKLHGELVKKLEITLLSINVVLNDAEQKQFTNSDVNKLLDELKDVVYAAEDALDEIATEVSKRNLDMEFQTDAKKVRNFISTTPDPFDKEIESKVQEIPERLDDLKEQKYVLALKDDVKQRPGSRNSPTSSLVEESSVYGRENDKETIMNLLLSDDASSNKISVITIVGLGGVGKTTLAQLIYNDNHVKEFFELKAWVCVSKEFDVVRVTKTVLEAVTSSTPETDDPTLLQVELKEKLMEKKFLLVLDDVWSYDDWEILRSPFNFGAHGSKIIVTTRSERVASVMRTAPTYHLKLLSDEDRWLLFAKHAVDNGAAWQKASWIFVITNFVLELLSAVFGQLSSSRKPYFALIAMLISFLAMLVCIVDLIFKGRKERVSWRRRGKICWFYPHQSYKRFGTFTDIVGLLCAISQFIVSTVQYSYFLRNASNPIKISMWSVVFASGLVCSQLLAKTDTSTPPQQEDP